MMYIDTHSHLHDSEFYPDGREEPYRLSREAGVSILCVGTDIRSSREAVEFAATHDGCWAVVGVHPHEASKENIAEIHALLQTNSQIVGVGEIGLDYFYTHSPRAAQIAAFEAQLQLAVDFHLPVSFHVRDGAGETSVWEDFWPILDNFSGVRGVLHSFTDTRQQAEAGMSRGLYIGINGISTFTKDALQQELYRTLPLERIVLETDAPYLTPVPFRGTMNISAYVVEVAKCQASVRACSLDEIASVTTINATTLFNL